MYRFIVPVISAVVIGNCGGNEKVFVDLQEGKETRIRQLELDYNQKFCAYIGGEAEIEHSYRYGGLDRSYMIECETDNYVYDNSLDEHPSNLNRAREDLSASQIEIIEWIIALAAEMELFRTSNCQGDADATVKHGGILKEVRYVDKPRTTSRAIRYYDVSGEQPAQDIPDFDPEGRYLKAVCREGDASKWRVLLKDDTLLRPYTKLLNLVVQDLAQPAIIIEMTRALLVEELTGKIPVLVLFDTDGRTSKYEEQMAEASAAVGVLFLNLLDGLSDAREIENREVPAPKEEEEGGEEEDKEEVKTKEDWDEDDYSREFCKFVVGGDAELSVPAPEDTRYIIGCQTDNYVFEVVLDKHPTFYRHHGNVDVVARVLESALYSPVETEEESEEGAPPPADKTPVVIVIDTDGKEGDYEQSVRDACTKNNIQHFRFSHKMLEVEENEEETETTDKGE